MVAAYRRKLIRDQSFEYGTALWSAVDKIASDYNTVRAYLLQIREYRVQSGDVSMNIGDNSKAGQRQELISMALGLENSLLLFFTL
jgi:hypothetical protein